MHHFTLKNELNLRTEKRAVSTEQVQKIMIYVLDAFNSKPDGFSTETDRYLGNERRKKTGTVRGQFPTRAKIFAIQIHMTQCKALNI
jgi:hypothetical protein